MYFLWEEENLIKLLLGILALGLHALYGEATLHAVPAFTLDLSLPPRQRWAGAVATVMTHHSWSDSFGPVFGLYDPMLSRLPFNTSETLLGILRERYPVEYEELLGLSEALYIHDPSISPEKMVLYVFMTELLHVKDVGLGSVRPGCTGILLQTRGGEVLHGRNMDLQPLQARNITLNITVINSTTNSVLYSVFDWSWVTMGFATASRLGGVTLEQNWRVAEDGLPQPWAATMERLLDPRTIPIQFVHRIIQEKAMNFDAAVALLKTSLFAAPFYNIVSGPGGRGAVLSVDWHKEKSVVEFLSEPVGSFLVQTNYDRWLPDPPADPRRTVAERTLILLLGSSEGAPRVPVTLLEQRPGDLVLWMALSEYPVYEVSTMFSVILSVNKDPEGYVRDPLVPKVPR